MTKNIKEICEEYPKSETPLQDYTEDYGLDNFYKSIKLNMTANHPEHADNLNIDEDIKIFLDNIGNQLNTFFVGKKGKGYWFQEIKFTYSCFSGYEPYLISTIQNKFCSGINQEKDKT